MDRRTHEPLSVAEAKERLRRAARSRRGPTAAARTWLPALARSKPWLALTVALGAGFAVGASKRLRARLPRILLELLG
jgi:hypothetical protein